MQESVVQMTKKTSEYNHFLKVIEGKVTNINLFTYISQTYFVTLEEAKVMRANRK